MDVLTPEHVQTALHALHLDIVIEMFPHSTATSPLAAEALGCEIGQIAKSLCFLVNDHPILVIASGDQRVDDRKLATLLGYAPGGVPPVGHRHRPHAVYLDASLQRYAQLYPAGGASNAIFGVTLAQLAQISGGTFVDIRRDA